MSALKKQYEFSVQSLKELLRDLNNHKESRRKVPIKGLTGLQAHPKKPKSQSKYTISLVYSYKHRITKTMVYVDLGVFTGSAKCLNVIDAKHGEARRLKNQGIHANFKDGYDEVIDIDGRTKNSGGKRLKSVYSDWWDATSKKLSSNSKKYFPRYMQHLLDNHSQKLIKNISKQDILFTLDEIQKKAIVNSKRFKRNWTKTDEGKEPEFTPAEHTGNSSFNMALSVYNIFFKWCIKHEHIDKSPSVLIDNKEETIEAEATPDDASLIRYLQTLYLDDVICSQQRRLMSLLIFTGLRPGEWISMRQKHLNLKEKTVKITKERAKTKKEFEIPLSNEAWSLVVAQIKHTGYTKPNDLVFAAECQENWKLSPRNKGKVGKNHLMNGCSLNPYQKRICKMADIDYFKPYMLRHIFTTLMGKMAVLPEVQRRLVCHAVNKDVHEKTYLHYQFIKEMRVASCRISTYLTYLVWKPDFNFDDFNQSIDYWTSDHGQEFMDEENIEFKDMYIISFLKLKERLSKTGLLQDSKQYKQLLLRELNDIPH